MKAQKIGLKIKFFFVLLFLFAFSTACDESQSGKATYTFTIQVSDEFMQKQRETAEAMAGGKSVEDIMKMIKSVNSKRIYTLFFQENKTVFSMDTEWYGQEDTNKTYLNYRTKEVIYPRESEISREAFPKANWEITDETKKIEKWNARKAIAEFDGQTITAWFVKDDNLRITPKNYTGLDGIVVELILEKGAKYTLTNLEFDKSIKVDLP